MAGPGSRTYVVGLVRVGRAEARTAGLLPGDSEEEGGSNSEVGLGCLCETVRAFKDRMFLRRKQTLLRAWSSLCVGRKRHRAFVSRGLQRVRRSALRRAFVEWKSMTNEGVRLQLEDSSDRFSKRMHELQANLSAAETAQSTRLCPGWRSTRRRGAHCSRQQILRARDFLFPEQWDAGRILSLDGGDVRIVGSPTGAQRPLRVRHPRAADAARLWGLRWERGAGGLTRLECERRRRHFPLVTARPRHGRSPRPPLPRLLLPAALRPRRGPFWRVPFRFRPAERAELGGWVGAELGGWVGGWVLNWTAGSGASRWWPGIPPGHGGST
ncbi:hypothetical protein KFL_001110250 [Klebsormidium nitens]|uniref:Uncharacterized protein n=1 Tax=Klebsormidium nitens TaxID=105231 RepID=A0A1Y1I2U2_KLENI|nr:hypothetical protein KFL_001110250 [Klebsormidium nitens]|eukprot:GAQ82448.1 hypothetical protein KFL_001110250 [Klebsormidium nitens]